MSVIKLLYIWINKSFNELINKQGFPLSQEFNYEWHKNVLHIERNQQYFNDIFCENSKINGVTAIVGENGSGKTTLLRELITKDVAFPPHINSKPGYEEFEKDEYERNKVILILLNNKNKLNVITNISNVLFFDEDNGTFITPVNNNQFIEDTTSKEHLTYIYLSNSGQDIPEMKASMRNYQRYRNIYLTTSSLRSLSKGFWQEKLFSTNFSSDRTAIMKNLSLENNENNYNSLQTFMYFLFSTAFTENEFLGKEINEYILQTNSLIKYSNFANRNLISNTSTTRNTNNDTYLEDKSTLSNYVLYFYQILNSKGSYFNTLIAQLFAEIAFVFNLKTKDVKRLYDKRKNVINNLDNVLDRISAISEPTNNSEVKCYYSQAIDFTKRLIKLVDKKIVPFNKLPKSDLGYQEGLILNIKHDKRIVSLLNEMLMSNNWCILKYLSLKLNLLSSGEEAILNLYSRLYWFLNENETKDNLVLLLDEIDLYLHPEWQRQFLDYFLSDIPKFVGDKKVQIILTTHSPISLSDIPKQNILFLKKVEKDGKHCCVIDKGTHDETFASNIHKLYSDSFFLKNKALIGEYAKKKINKAFAILKNDELKQSEIVYIRSIISLLGESVIKSTLKSQFERKHNNDSNR